MFTCVGALVWREQLLVRVWVGFLVEPICQFATGTPTLQQLHFVCWRQRRGAGACKLNTMLQRGYSATLRSSRCRASSSPKQHGGLGDSAARACLITHPYKAIFFDRQTVHHQTSHSVACAATPTSPSGPAETASAATAAAPAPAPVDHSLDPFRSLVEGRRFHCTQCGKCCTGSGEVRLSTAESAT